MAASADELSTALFLTYLPIPVVQLTDPSGVQSVYIAPEAFNVSSVEFADEIQVWEDALPGSLQLESVGVCLPVCIATTLINMLFTCSFLVPRCLLSTAPILSLQWTPTHKLRVLCSPLAHARTRVYFH